MKDAAKDEREPHFLPIDDESTLAFSFNQETRLIRTNDHGAIGQSQLWREIVDGCWMWTRLNRLVKTLCKARTM